MNKTLFIVGAGGQGKVIADLSEVLGFSVKFFDDSFPSKTSLEHWPVSGTVSDLINLEKGNEEYSPNVIVAIGDNEVRSQKLELLERHNFNIVTLIHPSAVISKYSKIEAGSVILGNAVINAFAFIGVGCIINTNCVIEHDCIVRDYCHISPNVALAGGVTVGKKTWVGIGSQVKQLVSIGNNCTIGAGSNVIKNIPDNVTAFGSPAIPI